MKAAIRDRLRVMMQEQPLQLETRMTDAERAWPLLLASGRCERSVMSDRCGSGSKHSLTVRPDIRGHRSANGRKATRSRLTDVVTRMTA
ncbi:hypothetical protein [Caballeronia sp. 15711]|uniref:hypothetical protein n=1 Tax=Caballeronia sp. 15711 TaxID=3391029 RepID=UPI0039E650B3